MFHTLGLLGRTALQQRLARERRGLAAAAPGLVPAEAWFAEPAAPHSPTQAASATEKGLRIAWQGSQAALHSLALVNRELCTELIRRGHELTLLPPSTPDPPGTAWPLPATLSERVGRPLSGPADVHVRLQWPPDFTPPAEGHWVMMQPWEFGSLPRAWLGPMSQLVDEVWVPTGFVRDGFVNSGVPADRVHVVPCGVGPAFFGEAGPYPLKTAKRFKFLFVGGTIDRKGIDILLKAYQQTFSGRDDVCLVIKDMGVGTFYRGQTMEERIAYLANVPDAPAVEYLSQQLTTEEMVGLYRACDCLVAPYRGEGFGLPIAEAMAAGLPVLRSRKHIALAEYPAAHGWLERAITQYPHEIWPRVLYSRVLMQDGSDRATVERALRDVLTVDPNHAEARRNLEMLLNGNGEHKNGA